MEEEEAKEGEEEDEDEAVDYSESNLDVDRATTTSHPRRPSWHVPLKGSPRVGSCGRFRLKRSHLGLEPRGRWTAVARRLHHKRGYRLQSYF